MTLFIIILIIDLAVVWFWYTKHRAGKLIVPKPSHSTHLTPPMHSGGVGKGTTGKGTVKQPRK